MSRKKRHNKCDRIRRKMKKSRAESLSALARKSEYWIWQGCESENLKTRGYVHYTQLSQNKILVRILWNSKPIFILFILPEVRDFSKLKTVMS
jgi:hypothetical protein